MPKSRRLYYASEGFDSLASLRQYNQLIIGEVIMKQFAFLIISSTPSLKNIAQNSSDFFFYYISLFSPFFVSLP